MSKNRKIVGYIRVSTEKQDLDKQRHLLLEYARDKQLHIDEFVEIEMSSRKSSAARRIDELLAKLKKGDLLLVAELSRLGREMLQVLNIINDLSEKGVEITFIRQPELSTSGEYGKLLLAIYSYFAEAERTFISMRVKQGLAAAKAKGVQLGRPKGSRNKRRVLDEHRQTILMYLERGVDLANVRKLINPELERPISYNSYKYFVQHDPVLADAWQSQRT
jgi:DNA invertase Pin-like site-specific DNA recombinase